MIWGNPGGSGNWNGEEMEREWGVGGQFTSNLGPGWTGSQQTRGGIPSKKEGFKGKKESARGVNKEKPARGYWQRVAPSLNIANLCIHIVSLYECS